MSLSKSPWLSLCKWFTCTFILYLRETPFLVNTKLVYVLKVKRHKFWSLLFCVCYFRLFFFVCLFVCLFVSLFAGPSIHIEIRSEGCNDPGIKPNTCGIAYIKVDGKDYSPHRRGHNVVIVDAVTGNVLNQP